MQMTKKITSIVLAVLMVVSMMSVMAVSTASAADFVAQDVTTGTKYESLEEAIAKISTVTSEYHSKSGLTINKYKANGTIKLLADCEGNGIVIDSGSNLTIDFDGHTYNVNGGLVGSNGTETNGFQLLQNSDVTFKNGTITSDKAKILVQNYSNLTLDGMTLTLNNPNYAYGYTLSNNNGNTVIKDSKINANPAGGYAFDVCRYSSYPSVRVTVNGASVINGNVEISASKNDLKDGLSLNFASGKITGTVVVDASTEAAINADGNSSITNESTKVAAVAKIGDTGYATLADAITAAQDGDTVTLMADVTEIATISGKTLTLDLYGFNITSTSKKAPVRAENGAKLTIVNSNAAKVENTATQNAIMGPSGSNNYGSVNANGEGTTVDIYAGYYYGYNGNKTAVNAINGATVTFWGGTVNGAEGIDDTTAGKEGKVFYSGVSNPTKPYDTSPGTIIVHGGNFSGRMSDSNWGNYVIDGGTFDRNVVVLNENPVDANGNRVATASSSMNQIGTGTLAEAGWLADGYILKDNENGTYTVDGPYAAQIDSTYYETLEEAIAKISTVTSEYHSKSGLTINKYKANGTIKLLADCEGNGIVIDSGSNLTIDFDGNTYNVNGGLVGSNGTESIGFQLLQNSEVTFKNGTITSDKAQMIIQNYSDLTLDKMTIDGTNMAGDGNYVLSNNNGNVVIKDTTIDARQGCIAFDVCRYASYPSVNVTVTGDSEINGNVEVYASNGNPMNGFSLTLENGTMTGNIVVDPTAKAVIDAKSDKGVVTKNNAFGQTAPEGLVWEDNGNGTSSLVPAEENPLNALITRVSDGNKFDIKGQYYAGTLLGVQKKNKASVNAATTSDKGAQEAEEGDDIRFVAVLATDLITDPTVTDYGFVLAKANRKTKYSDVNFDNLKAHWGNGEKTISAKDTYNNICGNEAYGDPKDPTTDYKYITCAVNGMSKQDMVVARFYVVKGGKTYYAKYAGHNYKYTGCMTKADLAAVKD